MPKCCPKHHDDILEELRHLECSKDSMSKAHSRFILPRYIFLYSQCACIRNVSIQKCDREGEVPQIIALVVRSLTTSAAF